MCESIAFLILGHDIPLVHKVSKPIVDEQGLWVDFDISYSGLVVLILNTKLNLLKIKNKNHDGKFISILQSKDKVSFFLTFR